MARYVVLSLYALLGLAAGCQPTSVHGVVTDGLSGAPMSGVVVRLGGTAITATTGAGGEYRIVDVAPGQQKLELADPRFASGLAPGFAIADGQQLELQPLEVVPVPNHSGESVFVFAGGEYKSVRKMSSRPERFKGVSLPPERGWSASGITLVSPESFTHVVVQSAVGPTTSSAILEVQPVEFVAAGRNHLGNYSDVWPDYLRAKGPSESVSGRRFGHLSVYLVELGVGYYFVCQRESDGDGAAVCGAVQVLGVASNGQVSPASSD